MSDRFPGRSLIENLYATMIGLIWPFLYFNKTSYELLFKEFNWQLLGPIIYSYIFICDDYYTAQRAINHPALRPASWRNAIRFWIDILILVCFYGFTLSFKESYIVYLIILVYFLALIWCKLLHGDYVENKFTINTPQRYYVRHLARQQEIYCLALLLFVFSGILSNLLSYVSVKDNTVGFNLMGLNYETFKFVVDLNLMSLLWWLLGAHWLMRGVIALTYGVELPLAAKVVQSLNKFINVKIVNYIIQTLLFQVRYNKKYWVFILSILLALLPVQPRVIIIILLILFWYLRELASTEGFSYESTIVMSAENQSEDPAAAISALNFIRSLKPGDKK